MITSLTAEQQSQLSVYADFWIKVGLSCEPIHFDAAVDAVRLAVDCANLIENNEMPTHWHYAAGPNEAIKIARTIRPGMTADSFLENTIWGQHDADWMAYYSYMRDEVGVTGLEPIEGLRQVALNCGWVSIVDNHCIIHDRPLSLKFDEQKRAHCETGPAIEYRDGFKVYCWHGTQIPDKWIEEGISAKEALQVDNAELRRCASEIVGWSHILEQLSYKVIEQDEDPLIGTLVEVELPITNEESSLERFLLVQCGTGRQFAIPVPPDMNTALQANAWTYGLEAHEYNPEVRT